MVDLSLALYNFFFLYVNKLDLFVTRVKRSLIHDVLNGSWSWFLNSVYKRSSGNIHKLNRLQTCLQHDKFIIQQVVHTFIYNDSEVYNWKLKKPHATKTRLRTLNLNCKLLRAKDSKPPIKITNLIAIWFGSRSWNTHWQRAWVSHSQVNEHGRTSESCRVKISLELKRKRWIFQCTHGVLQKLAGGTFEAVE